MLSQCHLSERLQRLKALAALNTAQCPSVASALNTTQCPSVASLQLYQIARSCGDGVSVGAHGGVMPHGPRAQDISLECYWGQECAETSVRVGAYGLA